MTTKTDTETTYTIHISQGGIWAGDGRLRNGYIEDCAAALGAGGEDRAYGSSERAYEAIEAAVAHGEERVAVDGIEYTWTIDADALTETDGQ